jgi:hypothetical protein
LFSETLTCPSGRRLFFLLVLAVSLVIAMILSITFADTAEAQKKGIRVQISTFVFCNPNTFEQCTNTIDPFKATKTFTGSGTIQTNDVSFRSVETETDFSWCVFFGQVSDTDEYVCKTTTTRHIRHKHSR